MSDFQMQPRETPCPTCPYRKTCPGGVWHESEYQKLPEYDSDTATQPAGVFLCHDASDKRTMCRGWIDTHDKDQLLSLRLAVSMGRVDSSIFDLPHSGVLTFATGQEAADCGMAEIESPPRIARRVIDKLSKRKIK